MPLQLLSRPTTDTIRSRSPSPLTTPTSKPQIPTIRLTTATPCDSGINDVSRIAPWTTFEASPIPIAPKPSTNGETSRKRLVPKKSKLSLLGSSLAKVRERELSDVQCTGGTSSQNGSNGFEIYVDPANDPDIGEILMVKKKKSRLGLDGLQWGTLGEVTNVPTATKPKEKKLSKKESMLKVMLDENQKWWSIGRGRKDSKEKERDKDKAKDKIRAKAPEPDNRPGDTRARFNSLDSGALLTSSVRTEHVNAPAEQLRVPTPPSATLAPPNATSSGGGGGGGKGSVALRAMRSVRSLARIGSWAQLKNMPNPDAVATAPAPVKEKGPDGKKKKKKKDKEKEKDRAEETIRRYSGSSFEAGALSASPVASKHEFSKSLGKKKASILGLGLPSTMRLPTTRSGSTASSIVADNTHRLSADSAALLNGGILARGRSGSTMSTVSSLRPMSTKSRESSGSSGAASVKWDEAGLQTMKEIRKKDKETRSKAREEAKAKEEAKDRKKSKRSKSEKGKHSTSKSSDSRKRTPLSAIFPGTLSEREEDEPPATPIIAIERATVDGHESPDRHSAMQTPVKRVRPRPTSEQPLSTSRPEPFCESRDDDVVLSLLDAATNDLAQLINRLDLEATPGSVEKTPLGHCSSTSSQPKKRVAAESPVKGLCRKSPSVTSLHPYAQISNSIGVQLGQNIAPWATLNAGISPSKPSPSTIRVNFQDSMATVRTHRRTMTPAPAAEPSPVFKPLRPATTRIPVSKTVAGASGAGVVPFTIGAVDRSPSAFTFGSGHSKSESNGSLAVSPVFKKAQGHTRKRSSLVPQAALDSHNLPIAPEARRSLGLAGTMGGSVGSIAGQVYDGSDPDSDIPDELQVILSNSDQEGDDTLSFKSKPANMSFTSPGLPPEMPLPPVASVSGKGSFTDIPTFRATLVDEDDHQADVEEVGTLSEDDTKRSFDFTGELQKLNESGASDRRSFIEQLENAFRTPAKIDLEYDFGELPPVPKLPTLQDELSQVESSFNLPIDYESRELSPRGFPIDVNVEPSLLPGLDSFITTTSQEELFKPIAPEASRSAPSIACHPSNGELNRDFKFGGKHSTSDKKHLSPLTLSDIIPPPEIARSLSMASFAGDESSLLKSILAHAIELESPPERARLDSSTNSKNKPPDNAEEPSVAAGHKRNSSASSFVGFDSFTEVRRGFEFHDNRPGFYPAATMSGRRHRKHESVYSIASVSSYGKLLHGGSADPFDFGTMASLPSLRERPSSDDFSFTMSSIDDTFSFLRRQPYRRRVDSDASGFYFRSSFVHPYNRSQRRPESGISLCPPVSLFNRNSTYHRRSDSNASISSVALSYANCRRFSWTRRRSNCSVESIVSDYTGAHLARPGLGDKMLDSAQERGAPLASISASPSPSPSSLRNERPYSDEYDPRTSYDSILDTQHESQKTDSLFEKTNHRNSVSSTDSTFFEASSEDGANQKPPRYRPISSLSIPSVHSPPKEDDTMISMLGGGRVRRRSVTSMIGSSPCIQVERRKNIVAHPPETVFSRIKNAHPEEDNESPEKSRVIEPKPSIASSTNSLQFGDDRMIRAKHGLLERQSLENTALSADGEDFSASFRLPVFTRPPNASRSRSSTCTSSSGVDTPPLSISDGYSSFSEGSLSSIDLSQLSTLLSNVTHPTSNIAFDRARTHARSQGHRRRISQARASRTSLYETIEEELTSQSHTNSPEHPVPDSTSNTVKLAEAAKMEPPPIYVVDPETSSIDSFSLWDDERGITALRRYYALRDEAEGAVTESKRTWLDTPLSVYATQSFDPPRHPSGMRAMLEHSLQNYGPLPSELRHGPVRSRVNSRPSPYPRTIKTSFTSSPAVEHLRASVAASLSPPSDNATSRQASPFSKALQQISFDPNVPSMIITESKERVVSPKKPERVFGLPPQPRVGATTKRAVLGTSKRSTGRNGAENKENNVANSKTGVGAQTVVNVSHGSIISPSDSLRLNRPRPRGRLAPASRPIRA